jgi:hypothetical protein
MTDHGNIKQKKIMGNVCPDCGMKLQEVHLESRKQLQLSKGWKHMIRIGEWCIKCEILWRE